MYNFKHIKLFHYHLKPLISLIQGEDIQSVRKDIFQFFSDFDKTSKKRISEKIEQLSDVCDIIENETGGGIVTTIAALLYIYFDKKELRELNIEENYSQSIFKIINGLLKVPEIKSEKIDKQADNFIKYLLTITDDVRSILILLVIQIYTIRNLNAFPAEQQSVFMNHISSLYVPLAHRIGLYNIKTELEEKVMKVKEKDMYKYIAGRLKETKASRDIYIEAFIKPLKKIIADAGYKAVIKGRPKSIHSIWNKMKTQSVSFDEVYDLFAIRIILKSDVNSEKAVCWNVYSIITDLYKPNPKRLRDWISTPKKLSGYESLHTTVLGPENKWVEVQIRTERMDEIAEKGPAAHWRYKSGKEGGNNEWLANIRETLENPSNLSDDSNKEKTKLYSEEIMVFTPAGDLKSLKKDYTVLDFAFNVHTKVGETCSGAIVNGKIQPLSYELRNGDTVKILTNKNKKPNQEWLKIAKSTKTKNKIKRALKSITYNYANVGKDIIKDKLERIKIDFSEHNIEVLTNYFNCKNAIEFYHKAGEGTIDISKIKNAFEGISEQISDKNYSEKFETVEKDQLSGEDYLLIDENVTDLDYKIAKCCNPLPGDLIFGFVTVNKGTKIHKKNVPKCC
jgi:guanosine-3',5'-bis(diphosphate) 3'-pyrophosphohydrolase